LIVALMIVFITAGALWAGFTWWERREAGTAVAQPVVRSKPKPTPMTQTTASVAPVMQTTVPVAPAPSPLTKTTTIAPPPPRPRPAPTAPDSSRYESMAREFAATATGNFTVQFAIVCEPSNVTRALNNGGTNVWFVSIPIKGRACYRMYWGRFGTRDEAERGMAALPASLRESKPAVVPISR
jgi:septal ring-binding cell division protein DamX